MRALFYELQPELQPATPAARRTPHAARRTTGQGACNATVYEAKRWFT